MNETEVRVHIVLVWKADCLASSAFSGQVRSVFSSVCLFAVCRSFVLSLFSLARGRFLSVLSYVVLLRRRDLGQNLTSVDRDGA